MTLDLTMNQSEQQSAQESAQQLVGQLQDAWNAGDGQAFAAPFAEDAHFVTVQGRPIAGRAAIAAGHHGIFTTIYAGSTNTMEMLHCESVADGVQLVQTRNTLSVPAGPLAGVRQAIGTLVLRATQTGWEILSSQNTLVEEAR
jgi:uncharacterized protein (TIGR02246 family)